jgi:hypothetical protein
MPLLGFTVLKDKLLDGSKTQTIRLPRKRPLAVGDKLYIYWKPRTKECAKLGESKVTKIVHKRVMDLNRLDAERDGFVEGRGLSALGHLNNALQKMHPDIQGLTFVDVVTFESFTFKILVPIEFHEGGQKE